MKKREIGHDVLRAYQGVNPSILPIEEQEKFRWLTSRTRNIYCSRLKLHPLLFYGARYLNLGCGSGEYDTVLASWGATGVGIDFNETSVERAKNIATKFGYAEQLTFSVGDICKLEGFNKEFDLAISDGVLPHVDDPEALLSSLAGSIKENGLVVLGYLDLFGNIQRSLHGLICRSLVDDSEDISAVVDIAKQLFSEHLERCVKFGGRSHEAVVNDYIVNRHSYGYDSVEIIRSMQNHGLQLFSSYPLSTEFIATEPADQVNNDPLHNIGYIRLQQLGWALGKDKNDWLLDDTFEDMELLKHLESYLDSDNDNNHIAILRSLRQIQKTSLRTLIDKLDHELDTALEELDRCLSSMQDFDPRDVLLKLQTTRIFRGYNGMSTCYLSFLSPLKDD